MFKFINKINKIEISLEKIYNEIKDVKELKLKQIKLEVATDDFEIDGEAEKEWLVKSNDNKGFKSYIKIRDLVLLKKIAIAVENRDFQLALEINGKRLEILRLLAEAAKQAKLTKLEI